MPSLRTSRSRGTRRASSSCRKRRRRSEVSGNPDLDPINADVINDLILRMQKQLKVVSIVVTHDMTSAYKVADRIAMLYEGVVIAQGTPDEIRASRDPVIEQFLAGSIEGPIQIM